MEDNTAERIEITSGTSSSDSVDMSIWVYWDHTYAKSASDIGNKKNPPNDVSAEVECTNSFQCEQCDRKFARKRYLIKHLKVHTGEKPFSCVICSKAFALKNNLYMHMRVHTGDRNYTCGHCERKFACKVSLRRHFLTHEKENIFNCHVCLSAEGQTADSEALVSSDTTSSDLLDDYNQFNVSSIQPESEPTLFTETVTSRVNDIPPMVSTPYKLFECSYCNRKFFKKYLLTNHIRIHTGERPFICSICPKTFTAKVNLSLHMIAHSGIRKFSCPHCDKKFSRSCNLREHIRIHERKKLFICQSCSTIKTSSNQRPTKLRQRCLCEFCGKTYSTEWYLKIHKKNIHN